MWAASMSHNQALAPMWSCIKKQVGLELSLSSGWGMYRGSGRKLASLFSLLWFQLPSPPCFGGKCVYTHSKADPRLSSALLLIPPALQPAKGTCVSCVRPQDWGTQYVGWNVHSPRRILPLCNLPFPLSSLAGAQVKPDYFTSLPAQLHVDFSHIPGCTGLFLPVFI